MKNNDRYKDFTDEFLINQYNVISEETKRLRIEGLNRLNFFITITSAVIGGLLILSQVGSLSVALLKLIFIGALVFLLLIGWDTFKFSISRDKSTDFNVRATGRISRYFSEKNQTLEKYLLWQNHDEPTNWIVRNTSGIRRTTQSVLSFLCALISSLIANFIIKELLILAIIAIIIFLIAYFYFRNYAKRQYKKASEIALASIKFPKTQD